ncbi:hypothetical protein LV89_03853 [Arcicella aurantiaca]|uniref:ParB-like nuclease family protein n=1 Tax=Arcicella aurantiaca TaxID=591202 RepID=A0A316DTZ4_9BACT|nr:hypothetical protein [Arcicella aurantiaca]PWK20043.1 hypothetical protein LV89_03853 [Arcicella aurantiaca]
MKTDIRNILASKTKQALSSNILNADNIRQNITVLDELKNLIPPLSDEEFEQLEINIKKHGCQTPIQLWQAPKKELGLPYTQIDDLVYVLIDGHNRHKICTANNLAFEVYMLSFQTLKEAKDYMINLQLGRRNLSPSQISYFRGLRYNNEKTYKSDNLNSILPKGQNVPSGENAQIGTNLSEDIGQNFPKGQNVPSGENAQIGTNLSEEIGQNFPKGQNVPSGISTAERLATEYKVSAKTIKRDAEFAKGLDKLDIELRNDILTGREKVDKGIIQKIAKNDSIVEPISSLANILSDNTESVVFDYTEKNAKTATIKENTTQIINISKRFAKTNKKSDLENIIQIAQNMLALVD